MRLWYESLSLSLDDCGENQTQRTRCILSHLFMPVPRSWRERALITGHVDDTHVLVLVELLDYPIWLTFKPRYRLAQ
jgi:hypothetical protein